MRIQRKILRLSNGVIRFSVVSKGVTGNEWIGRLKNRGFSISEQAQNMLLSEYFIATTNTTYRVEVLPIGSKIVPDGHYQDEAIRSLAARRNLVTPGMELACLIRDNLSNDELKRFGFPYEIIVMHVPRELGIGPMPFLLTVCRVPMQQFTSKPILTHLSGIYEYAGGWFGDIGFAFISHQN